MAATQEISFANCQTLDQALEQVERLQLAAGSLEVEGENLRGFVIFVRGAVSAAFVQQGGLQGPAAMQKMRECAGLKISFIPAGAVPTPVVVPPVPQLPGQNTALGADPQALSGGWTWEMPAAPPEDEEYSWRAPASLRDLEETVPEMSLPLLTAPHESNPAPATAPYESNPAPATRPHEFNPAPATALHEFNPAPATALHDSDRAPAPRAARSQPQAKRTALDAATLVAPVAVLTLTIALFTVPDLIRSNTINPAATQFAAQQTQAIVEEQLKRCSPLAHHWAAAASSIP